MSKEVVVVVRDGVVDRVFCSDPETVVTVINFGFVGEQRFGSGLEQYKYPSQEWDMAEIAEIADEYNSRVARRINPKYVEYTENKEKGSGGEGEIQW